jgi:hypothetical protein
VNRSTATTAPKTASRIARLAWLCAFVLPLVLAAALLVGVRAAQAQAPQPTVVSLALDGFEAEELAFEDEEELEEEEAAGLAEVECEVAEEEAAEGEITQAEADALCKEVEDFAGAGGGPTASSRCPIRSARAHASLKRHRLKLTIGYTTNAPVRATIQIPGVGTFKRRLGRSGVIRITKKLGREPVKRVTVRLKTPSCGQLQTRPTKVR